MASIHPTKAGGFRVHYTLPDGRRTASPVFPDQPAAEGWMRDHLPAAGVDRLVSLLDLWAAADPRPDRMNAAGSLARIARAQGWTRVQDVTPAGLDAWLTTFKTAKRTTAAERLATPGPSNLRFLLAALRWAVRAHGAPVRPEVVAYRPPRHLRPHKRPKPPLLDDRQVEAVRLAASEYGARAVALVDYLLTYAPRPQMAARLTRADLDVGRAELTHRNPKHRDTYRHPIQPTEAASWSSLADWTDEPSAPLFPHYLEDRAWRSGLEMATWYRNTVAKAAGLTGPLLGIYNLKRRAITGQLQAGLDPSTVALFSGHKTLSQVLTYATTNQKAATAALDRLPKLPVTPVVTRLHDVGT